MVVPASDRSAAAGATLTIGVRARGSAGGGGLGGGGGDDAMFQISATSMQTTPLVLSSGPVGSQIGAPAPIRVIVRPRPLVL